MQQEIKPIGDAVFAVAAWAAFFKITYAIVAFIAALLSVAWFAIRIWEKASGREFSTTWLAKLLTWR